MKLGRKEIGKAQWNKCEMSETKEEREFNKRSREE